MGKKLGIHAYGDVYKRQGMMLAILLMNIFAPLIDYCIVQKNITARENRLKSTNN